MDDGIGQRLSELHPAPLPETGTPGYRRAFLSTVAAGRGDRDAAFVVILLAALAFAAAIPFAKVPLAPIPAFIPCYESALFLIDAVTAVLLFGQFRGSGSPALLILGAGYLYDAQLTAVHLLTFPGAFSPTGLLGANMQTTAWLYMFWHGGFPLFLIGYALANARWPDGMPAIWERLGAATVVIAIGAVCTLAAGLTMLALHADTMLPAIMSGNSDRAVLHYVVGCVWVAGMAAIVVLWRQRRQTVLDLWLIVVANVWVFDVALSAVFDAARFDLGFYAGRAYGLLAASFVLGVLLIETGGLHSRLAAATAELEGHAAELEDRVRERTGRLDRANRQLSAIIEASPVAVFMLDRDGRVMVWSASAERIFGYTEAEALGGLPPHLLTENSAPFRANLTRAADGLAAAGALETRNLRKDGTVIDTLARWVRVDDEAGHMLGIMCAAADITQHKRAERQLLAAQQRAEATLAALRSSEELLKRAQRLAQIGSTVRNLRTGAVEWSDEAYRIFGVTRETWTPTPEAILAMVHPEDRAMVAAALDSHRDAAPPAESRIIRADGAVRVLYREAEIIRDAAGDPLHLVGTLQDITERKNTEEQLRQSQKMEAIGNLTGGMAHDFNNLLGIIVGNLDMARGRIGENEELAEIVAEALDAAWRGADLTRRLLAFARRQPLRPARVDVNELIGDAVKLLRRLLGEDVEVTLDLGDDVWPIIVDPAQLEASLANLATNARDAMPQGGRLIIATANRQLDADYVAAYPDATAGDFVMIEVSDTGTGMSPEVRRRIFEPFFTTKETGKGTGLGLSMVFGFLRQSEGHVNVYSEEGAGTTFRLYLPRAKTEAAAREAADPDAAPRGTGQMILIVEDNKGMRRIVGRQLDALGYRVRACDSAKEALDILAREPVDLLFTDIVMPGGTDGVELVRLARERRPELKVVLTSGFPQSRLDKRVPPGGPQLLSKPYRREDLATALHVALHG
jgi:PAS domain S-box-containing protein